MSLLENTALFFTVPIIIGLAYPQLSPLTGAFIIPFFIVAATLSLTHMKTSRKDIRRNAPVSLKAVLLSYGLLSSVTIILAYLLLPNTDYFTGFVILAAAPPAVAVIPFTYLLKGDTKAALGGELLSYLLALGFAPLITFVFIGQSVDVFEIVKTLSLIILLPLFLSRLLLRHPHYTDRYQKIIVNFCFGFINYSVIGLNHEAILMEPLSLTPVFAVHLLAVFIPGTLVYFIGRKMNVEKGRCIAYTLFSSIKNGGMTATLALILFSPAASLPGAIHGPFTIAFFLFFEYLLRRC